MNRKQIENMAIGLAALRTITEIIRPPNRAEQIKAFGSLFNAQVKAATGERMYVQCGLEIVYPTMTLNVWHLWHCPGPKGHEGLHSDENFYPFITTSDVEWFAERYREWNEANPT